MRTRYGTIAGHGTPIALILLVAASAACASAPGAAPSTTASGATVASRPMRDRSVLTREEILRGEYQTAYDAILALRRPWLLERTDRMREATPTIVYIDDMKMGGLEELRAIPVARIARIKYYDGTQAYARWGLGHDRGAIQVIVLVPDVRRP